MTDGQPESVTLIALLPFSLSSSLLCPTLFLQRHVHRHMQLKQRKDCSSLSGVQCVHSLRWRLATCILIRKECRTRDPKRTQEGVSQETRSEGSLTRQTGDTRVVQDKKGSRCCSGAEALAPLHVTEGQRISKAVLLVLTFY